MLDTTWAEVVVVKNADGSNVGGGGGSTPKATAADPAYVEGTLNPLSLDLSGHLRVVQAAVGGGLTDTQLRATAVPVSIAAAVDVSDRAGRLLGVVYGSQGQQLKQTATNFNLQAEVFVGGTAIDPRSTRALTSSDTVTANQGSAAAVASAWPAKISDGTNTVGIAGGTAAANETLTDRLKANAELRLLDTAQTVGSQLVAAKGDQTTGLWVNVKNASVAVTNAGTFAVQATLAAETTKVIGTVNQGTSPWVTTANIGTTNGLALDATLTGRTQKSQITDGTRDGTVKAASTLPLATDTAVVVTLRESLSTPVTGTFFQSTQPVSLATNTPDVTDRAARLVGVVYGSQAQQLKQTATNFNAQVEVAVGGTLIDPRSIRSLTSADVVSAAQSGTWTVQLPDVTGTLGALGALNATAAVALTGQHSASMLLAAGTLIGTIVPEVSLDGGTNWIASYFWDQATTTAAAAVVFGSANTVTSRTIFIPGGTTHARIRVSAFTSGTANCTVRAVTTNFPLGAPFRIMGGPNGSVSMVDVVAGAGNVDGLGTSFNNLIVTDYAFRFNGTNWDRYRGNYDTTTGDTGAKTVTFAGATQTNYNDRGAFITIRLGTVTGTTPTLSAQLQWSPDGGTTWLNIGAALANLTATSQTGTIWVYPTNSSTAGATPAALTTGATATLMLNAVLPRTWRLNYTIGGTTPSFTITAVNVNYIV
ncbi:MAG: hypothetical protein M3003_15170 [Candidatus Dormibacteraeota bacterium]|nr:hypothetical protein [Candidatus Dormibacteraeota bacterium]